MGEVDLDRGRSLRRVRILNGRFGGLLVFGEFDSMDGFDELLVFSVVLLLVLREVLGDLVLAALQEDVAGCVRVKSPPSA